MKKLSRRTMLKGAGTIVALPFLDAMLPAFGASTPQVPMRMLYVYAPTGIMPQYWTPTATGRDFEFQRVMKPLCFVRSNCPTVRLPASSGRVADFRAGRVIGKSCESSKVM